eukprot:TRINITY_DN3670_c0_g1_i3.p1 TRINITY_DN3670_c0_g1~~TRINITY_DN3670_c0_g1_i3.p1  ORF type:complete len:464 (+),score=78.12 TRINITY_DN3670_c0_g1_i3:76-1392(+)
MSRPDRGGLPLNVDAAPFVPGGGGGGVAAPEYENGENAWKAQAEQLAVTPTPPLRYVTPPTSAGSRTPIAGPMVQGGTPSSAPKSTVTCPTGHTMRHCQGNQVISHDGRLVSVGGVFCRLCDSESLESHTQGYYSCQECHWDCCILCAASQQAYVPPMSLGLHAQHKKITPTAADYIDKEKNLTQEVIESIRYHLKLLSDEEPCGLSSMPLEKLKIYDDYLKDKIAKKKSTVQKVSVTKAEEPPPAATTSRKKKPAEPKKLKFSVNDKIQFVGGGRFSGNKRWKDGAKLTIGDYGLVKEIDVNENFLYKCQFDNVYVKLSEADIVVAQRKQPVVEKPATVTPRGEAKESANLPSSESNNTNNNAEQATKEPEPEKATTPPANGGSSSVEEKPSPVDETAPAPLTQKSVDKEASLPRPSSTTPLVITAKQPRIRAYLSH